MKDYELYHYGKGVTLKLSKNTAELWDNGVTVKTVHGWSEASRMHDEALALADSRR